MKEMLKKKRVVSMGTIEMSHHCSVVIANNLATKREDPGTLIIPYAIRAYKFDKALFDLGEV